MYYFGLPKHHFQTLKPFRVFEQSKNCLEQLVKKLHSYENAIFATNSCSPCIAYTSFTLYKSPFFIVWMQSRKKCKFLRKSYSSTMLHENHFLVLSQSNIFVTHKKHLCSKMWQEANYDTPSHFLWTFVGNRFWSSYSWINQQIISFIKLIIFVNFVYYYFSHEIWIYSPFWFNLIVHLLRITDIP